MAAVRALEVAELDDRDQRLLQAADVVPLRVNRGDQVLDEPGVTEQQPGPPLRGRQLRHPEHTQVSPAATSTADSAPSLASARFCPVNARVAKSSAHILGVPHVHAVHDLHASSVSSDLPVLTAHVVVDDSCFRDGHLPRLLDQLQQCLAGHFDVEHSTVQFEPASHAAHEHAAHA